MVNDTKFLGLHIDGGLTWKPHTEETCRKLNQFAYALYKLAKQASVEVVMTAYHGFVASTLRYGTMYWANSTNRETVFKAQKRCIRAIRGLKQTDSCVSHFDNLKILTLPCLYVFEAAVFVKANPTLFKTVSEFFPRSTRYGEYIFTEPANTALKQKSMFCVSSKIFNKLPDRIKNLPLPIFKTELKKLLTKKCFYTISDFLTCDSL